MRSLPPLFLRLCTVLQFCSTILRAAKCEIIKQGKIGNGKRNKDSFFSTFNPIFLSKQFCSVVYNSHVYLQQLLKIEEYILTECLWQKIGTVEYSAEAHFSRNVPNFKECPKFQKIQKRTQFSKNVKF